MAFSLKDYKDIQEVARGGMGKVYLSTQISLNRKVIIKEMATGLLTNATEIKRFENEARAAALLNHDNVIRIYDFGEDRGSFYISMEYVDGPDLETILKDKYCVPEIALMIVLHALKGLHFAHQHQIIHRDIKPGNILVSKAGAVKVVDFGLAHAGAQQMHLTATDMIVGTPLYMSPEQASGEEKKSIQMDVWSVGVLLYRIITGDFPFKGDNVPAILFNIVQSKQAPIQEKIPALPDDLAQIIDQCLEKDRGQRLTDLMPIIESLQNYFFEIGIRDTAELIRKYISDPASCVKELSHLLLEFHGQKSLEFEAEGNMPKSRAHLVEAKKFDSTYKPIAKAIDAFKKHTTTGAIKKSAPVTVNMKSGSRWRSSGGKSAKRFIIAAIIVLVVAAGGGAVYFYLSTKGPVDQPGPQVTAVPEQKDTVRHASSVDTVAKAHADSTKKQDSLGTAAAGPAAAQPTITKTKTAAPAQPTAAVPSTGILKVSINPSSAKVTIDGAALSAGEMSAGKRLKTGTHLLVAQCAGYENYSRTVTVEKGPVQIISADLVPLEKKMATIHIFSYPWAEIYIDGVSFGNSPTAKPLTLPEGPHLVMLKRAGYITYQEKVNMVNGELTHIKAQLIPQ